MFPFIRKVKTASGATAVQIVEKRGGVRRIMEHVGSTRDDTGLAVLLHAAHDRLHEGQQAFGLNLGGSKLDQAAEASSAVASAVVTGTRCGVLWQVLADAYARLGFDALSDVTLSEPQQPRTRSSPSAQTVKPSS